MEHREIQVTADSLQQAAIMLEVGGSKFAHSSINPPFQPRALSLDLYSAEAAFSRDLEDPSI
jgi:hypothetical protein